MKAQTSVQKIVERATQAVEGALAALKPVSHGKPELKIHVEQLEAAQRQLKELAEPEPEAPAEKAGPDPKGPTGAKGHPGDKGGTAKPAPVSNKGPGPDEKGSKGPAGKKSAKEVDTDPDKELP